MSALSLLLQLLFSSFVVLLPVVVGWLAFRRLTRSKTSNAWIYAVTCLFAAVTTAGLLPWAVGFEATSWIFFVLAAFCPAIWFGVTTICDISRRSVDDHDIDDASMAVFKAHRKNSTPLLLDDPILDAPEPMFRHGTPANTDAPSAALVPKELPKAIGKKSILEVAREMRRNKSSEQRRPKLLPAPSVNELAFIKTSGTT